MSDQLLTIFRLCLLALLYVFFFRVLQAVWSEVRTPRLEPGARPRIAERPARGRRAGVPKARSLTIVEPDGLAGNRFDLGDELTIGRAAGCQITLDDTYASQLHTRVFRREGRYFVEDLGSTNGTYLNRNKVAAPMPVKPGDRIQVGSTVMEVN